MRKFSLDFVYLFGPNEFQGWPDLIKMKIGSTGNPCQRLQSLWSGNPDFSYWHVIHAPGYADQLESAFREFFRHQNNEVNDGSDWLQMSAVQIKFFASRCWDFHTAEPSCSSLKSSRFCLMTQLFEEWQVFEKSLQRA